MQIIYYIIYIFFIKLSTDAEKIIEHLNMETIQFINNSKEKTPIKIFLFFFKNLHECNQMQEKTYEDLIEIIKDIKYFYYFNKNYLLIKPIKIELVNGEISKPIILHNSNQNLQGVFIFFITFDGIFYKKFIIPGDANDNKNIIIILDKLNKIIVKNGLFTYK